MIDPARAFQRIVEQAALGPRFVGSPGHARVVEWIRSWLRAADECREHRFRDRFWGQDVECANLWARYVGRRPGRVMLGTHFDTRPWADRDPDPRRRRDPVPGANDGGSGTAVLVELAAELVCRRDRKTIDIVFFDAEDWHDIDGHQVSLGARRFVADLNAGDRPEWILILDMIGGRDLMLDVDVNCQQDDRSFALTLELFQMGYGLGLPAFGLEKQSPYKWVVCDHSAFLAAGIPSSILIDLDYPPWHTVEDVPGACDVASLAQIAVFLERLVFGGPAGGPQ